MEIIETIVTLICPQLPWNCFSSAAGGYHLHGHPAFEMRDTFTPTLGLKLGRWLSRVLSYRYFDVYYVSA